VRKANRISAFQPAQGGTNGAIGANFAVNYTTSRLISAGTAGTQPALCAGTTKRQLAISPHFEFYLDFLRVSGSGGEFKKAQEAE